MTSPPLIEQLSAFHLLTPEQKAECLYWVRNFPDILLRLENPSPEIVLAAVASRGLILAHVKNQTPGICMAAVSQNGMALEQVRLQTPDICWAAIRKTPDAIQFVRERTRLQEIECARTSPPTLALIEDPGESAIYTALTVDPLSLQHVRVQQEDYCDFAIRKNPKSLKFVHAQTEALVRLAISGDPMSLEFVVPELQTDSLCRQAFDDNPLAVQFIRNEKLKNELLFHLLRGRLNLEKITYHFRNNPLYYFDLWSLDDRFKNEHLLAIALEFHPESVLAELWEWNESAPRDLLLKAVARDGILLRYIDPADQTPDICVAAVNQSSDAIVHVASVFLNECFRRSLEGIWYA